MLTSYYARVNMLKKEGHTNLVAISATVPDWLNKVDNIRCCDDVAPAFDILMAYKNGDIDWSTYSARYLAYLDEIDMDRIYKYLGDDAVLLCYEGIYKNCHRHLLADKLKQLYPNLSIEEFIP